MNYDQTATTVAPIEQAWTALAAVTALPQWTPSMSTVKPLDGEALRVGNRYRIKQPGFPPVVWRVSEVREGESFTWESNMPGIHTVGFHRLSRNSDGTSQITIGIRQTGMFAGLMAALTAARTRRYLELEVEGLKAAAEAAPSVA
jgi:uncharacterized membrane protein